MLTQFADTRNFTWIAGETADQIKLNFIVGFKEKRKCQMLLGDIRGGQTCNPQQRHTSFQVKSLCITWSPGEAVIKHHWKVLILLRLQAHFCLMEFSCKVPYCQT